MTKEELWLRVSKVTPEEWTNGDSRELRLVLSSPLMMKALQHAFLCEEDLKVQLATQDFIDIKSLAQANVLKGQLKGVVTLMDRLLGLSEETQETQDDGTELNDDAESGGLVSSGADFDPRV